MADRPEVETANAPETVGLLAGLGARVGWASGHGSDHLSVATHGHTGAVLAELGMEHVSEVVSPWSNATVDVMAHAGDFCARVLAGSGN